MDCNQSLDIRTRQRDRLGRPDKKLNATTNRRRLNASERGQWSLPRLGSLSLSVVLLVACLSTSEEGGLRFAFQDGAGGDYLVQQGGGSGGTGGVFRLQCEPTLHATMTMNRIDGKKQRRPIVNQIARNTPNEAPRTRQNARKTVAGMI